MVFILYKLYVPLPYTYPTPKLSPYRRRCISTFPQKNSLCMIYKRFKLWGHWKCPHKSPSPCNTCHTHVIIQICVLINHINMHTQVQKNSVYLKHKSVTLLISVTFDQFNAALTTFTFTYLADAFIQSDLQCIQAIHFIFIFFSMCVFWESNPQPLRC